MNNLLNLLNIKNLNTLNIKTVLTDLNGWLVSFAFTVAELFLIILLTYLAITIRKTAVKKLFSKIEGKKQQTLASLLLSFTKYVIITISGIMILECLGVNVGPILAGAGIIGIAVGFGAQDLVKDFIRGFFIMFEDQFHVGDVVQINGTINGTVDGLGLRMTTIKEWNGTLNYISNSSITLVKNYNRNHMRSLVSVLIAYEEDYQKVVEVINDFCAKFTENFKEHFAQDNEGNLIEPPQFHGIDDIIDNQVGAKYTVKCLVKDSSYFFINKELRRGLLQSLKQNGIMIAYPKRIYESIPVSEEK